MIMVKDNDLKLAGFKILTFKKRRKHTNYFLTFLQGQLPLTLTFGDNSKKLPWLPVKIFDSKLIRKISIAFRLYLYGSQ